MLFGILECERQCDERRKQSATEKNREYTRYLIIFRRTFDITQNISLSTSLLLSSFVNWMILLPFDILPFFSVLICVLRVNLSDSWQIHVICSSAALKVSYQHNRSAEIEMKPFPMTGYSLCSGLTMHMWSFVDSVVLNFLIAIAKQQRYSSSGQPLLQVGSLILASNLVNCNTRTPGVIPCLLYCAIYSSFAYMSKNGYWALSGHLTVADWTHWILSLLTKEVWDWVNLLINLPLRKIWNCKDAQHLHYWRGWYTFCPERCLSTWSWSIV